MYKINNNTIKRNFVYESHGEKRVYTECAGTKFVVNECTQFSVAAFYDTATL